MLFADTISNEALASLVVVLVLGIIANLIASAKNIKDLFKAKEGPETTLRRDHEELASRLGGEISALAHKIDSDVKDVCKDVEDVTRKVESNNERLAQFITKAEFAGTLDRMATRQDKQSEQISDLRLIVEQNYRNTNKEMHELVASAMKSIEDKQDKLYRYLHKAVTRKRQEGGDEE